MGRSNRINQLLAAAIQYSVRRRFRVELSTAECLVLASIGDINEAVKRFEEARSVELSGGARQLTGQARNVLAVTEAAASAHFPDETAGQRLKRRKVTVAQIQASEEATAAAAEELDEVARLLREEEAHSFELRRFLRKAADLRRMQLVQLHALVADPITLKVVQTELDVVYARVLKQALMPS